MSGSIEQFQSVEFTGQVKEQLVRIYEETNLVVVGTLGRTASMGGEPHYWTRHDGSIRDIDVYDPRQSTPDELIESVDNSPLPIDYVGDRWLQFEDDTAILRFPKDSGIFVELPSEYFEPVSNELLGIPVRTFRPEVMLGLNHAVPYDRLRQRNWANIFEQWVKTQDDYNPEILAPFDVLAEQIKSEHPEYIRYLRYRDLASYLPKPVLSALKSVHNR